MKRVSQFLTSYFLSVGVSNVLLLLLACFLSKTGTLLTPPFLLATDTSILINLGLYYPICVPQSPSPVQHWCRRFVWLCLVCILTPSVYFRFGCVSSEKWFHYLLNAGIMILCIGIALFWIIDQIITRINVDKINDKLNK